MRTLYIETATPVCAAMLADGGTLDWRSEAVGRGHAERLVPMIAALGDGGRAQRIIVDVGPGSFTGIRVGIAAARGLGLGWGAEVLGLSSLALVAITYLVETGFAGELAVVMEGGHGELFVQPFDGALTPLAPLASLVPAAALAAVGSRMAVGTGLKWLPELPAAQQGGALLPDIRHAPLLPEALRTLPPRPVYGRGADAKPMAARA